MGEALEEYVKDLFAGTLNEEDKNVRMKKFQEKFSYFGNQNNPPDFMIKGGDAVEVKKIESKNSSLALNSSYPKKKLNAKSTMITSACKECENCYEKDMIYAVGVIDKNKETLSSLAFVFGQDYSAKEEIYEKVREKIKEGVTTIPDIEFN